MNDRRSANPAERRQALMDEMLRNGVPEIKLALGEMIDRENARPLPPRYARLLPPTVLSVALREDAAEALRPVAADLERELTDSCNRHGSLYDRRYRVELQRTEDPDAPLYAVSVHAGRETGGEGSALPGPGGGTAAMAMPPVSGGAADGVPPAASPEKADLPLASADVTLRGRETPSNWDDGRWVLIVEDEGGEEREVFRIAEPEVTIGRSADDPGQRPSIAISDAPHVSRRQLALVWEERDGSPGFRVHNLGLNTVHLPDRRIPGAHRSGSSLDLAGLPEEHTGWLAPGAPLRIGGRGPTLRIDELPPGRDDVPVDPDATVFD